jgi:shikimate kinase
MAPVVALIGFMGSGKTTVGRAVADRLDWRFADLDAEIQRRSGRGIREWFAGEGEIAFRRIETLTLDQVLREASVQVDSGVVLALGGGAVTVPASAALVREAALVVYLAVEPAVAWDRVQGSGRPLATTPEAFVALAESRESAYRACADAVVDCGRRAAADIAFEVLVLLTARGVAA